MDTINIKYLIVLFAYLTSAAFLNASQVLDQSYSDQDSSITEIHTLDRYNAKLEGTLVYHELDYPAPLVIIISGSGPTDRDGNQTGLQNDCFKLLAEELAKNEIASFRFDKRGVGKSSNSLETIHLRFDHFVSDIIAWVDHFKADERFSNIIIAGHSLGSSMGIHASQAVEISAFISLAGPGKSMDSLMYEQIHAQSPFLAKGAKVVMDSLKRGHQVKEVHPLLTNLFPPMLHNYLISMFAFDPAEEISKLNIPVLIIQGTHDIQIPVDDAERLHQYAKNSNLAIIDSMNHVLKDSPLDRTENIASYSDPELPVNALMVEKILEFILDITY